MSLDSLQPGPDLVGRKVMVPTRPEWGVGEVLRVSQTRVNREIIFRVSVHFPSGHRTLLMPPARLVEPFPEKERQAGWLDSLGKNTLDGKLRALPEELQFFLGTPGQRFSEVAKLFEWDDRPESLVRWARRQSLASDPLTLWTRDELQAAFDEFCAKRDTYLRESYAAWRKSETWRGPAHAFAKLDAEVAARMRAVLGITGSEERSVLP